MKLRLKKRKSIAVVVPVDLERRLADGFGNLIAKKGRLRKMK